MKKIATYLICFLLGINATFGQEEMDASSSSKTYQIGFNAQKLVNNLRGRFNDPIVFFENPDLLILKIKKNNTAFRAALGVHFSKSEENGDKNTSISTGARIGFEKQKDISKRWQYYSGVDLRFSYNKGGTNFFGDNVKSTFYGLSPLLGFQFRILPNLVLQTEANITFGYTKTTGFSDLFILPPFPVPEPLFSDAVIGKNITVNVPRVLFLMLEF